jgi:glyoxylase-like metal-dependent hydrolase (beta-lactamase superfamily II)
MRRQLLPAIAAALVLCPHASRAASLKGALEVLGAAHVQSLEFSGSGHWYQFGQAPNPAAPWPAFELERYVAALDFSKGASRTQITRRQVVEAGRARPAPAEQKVEQFVVGDSAWNFGIPNNTPPGTPAVAQPQLASAEERAAEIWATPQGFVKAALAHGATVKAAGAGVEISFTLDGRHRFVGILDAKNQVEKVRTWIDSPVLGDTLIESTYSDYADFGGVRFPRRIVRSQGGFPVLELAVSEVKVNPAVAIQVPPEVAEARTRPAPVLATKLSDGAYYLTGGTHHSVVVEQGDHLVVIEAPLAEERSLAVIAKAKELFPGKPIAYLVNTHAHFDHLGGVRTFLAEGATVVTHAGNVAYYEALAAAPHTLAPDALARSKKAPRFKTFEDKLSLPDARHPVEVHAITGNGHDDAFALAYLPAEKILVEADAYTPLPEGAAPPSSPNPYSVNLYANIQRLKLDVERIAPLHGRLVTLNDLRVAIGASGAAAAAGRPEDVIKGRQGTFRVIGWHCARLKASIDGPFDQREIAASAAVIQSVSAAGFGAFFVHGTEKGVGYHESQARPEAFDPVNAAKLADLASALSRDAGELARIAAQADRAAVRARFANLTRSCKSCHEAFRIQP